ncbi:MAG: hydrolase [Spirochaetales bacterium]|nr:hydrolase [Spirochaetales bacterium]
MHKSNLTREQAFELLKKYNKDQFHIRHSLTMEGVMRWYACNLGFEDEADYWSQVGLLHDIDFENWPEEHCRKAPELLREGGCADDMIRSICSHGYGICVDIEPVELMEKVLFAADELSGLIWSASLMRPSKSVQDMEVKSVRKKYKDLKFAAGCSRDVINTGAERLGWELDKLIQMTLDAMRSCERSVEDYMAANY